MHFQNKDAVSGTKGMKSRKRHQIVAVALRAYLVRKINDEIIFLGILLHCCNLPLYKKSTLSFFSFHFSTRIFRESTERIASRKY